MKKERVVFFSDPLNDDFAGTKITSVTVDGNYPYKRSRLWRALSAALYFLALPAVFLTAKLYLGLKTENRKVFKKLKKTGFFLYGNHTQQLDAFIPPLAAFPHRAYIVANPDAVSIKGLKTVVQMLGCIPVPTELSGFRPFTEAVNGAIAGGGCVAIYPEAHIWPFYTGIRPFTDVSFSYPVKAGAPVIAMTTTYRRRRGLFALCKKPGMTVTFSDVLYPDPDLPPRQAQKDLRDLVFSFMEQTAAREGNIEYIRYVRVDPTAADE